ncbi:MAG: 7-carboxy-7-deazaguanine synthase QueE [Legionellaceae bacterium]|nr:7-carboxy-7-deazaguanine synthase QueE [Legionellaceae bacterium]
MTALRITEIFNSIQGESTTTGLPTTFIRLTGCPLRCQYCDTAYAFKGGKIVEIDALMQKVASFGCKNICVTGGEPLAQPNCQKLISKLSDAGYFVSIETSGAIDISTIDKRAMIVMDLKTPDSKECDKNIFENISHLKRTDQIKFVLCSRNDYDWACEILVKHNITAIADVLFSASWGQLNPTNLADWIIEDKLQVRFQLQLHKILWNDEPGH